MDSYWTLCQEYPANYEQFQEMELDENRVTNGSLPGYIETRDEVVREALGHLEELYRDVDSYHSAYLGCIQISHVQIAEAESRGDDQRVKKVKQELIHEEHASKLLEKDCEFLKSIYQRVSGVAQRVLAYNRQVLTERDVTRLVKSLDHLDDIAVELRIYAYTQFVKLSSTVDALSALEVTPYRAIEEADLEYDLLPYRSALCVMFARMAETIEVACHGVLEANPV